MMMIISTYKLKETTGNYTSNLYLPHLAELIIGKNADLIDLPIRPKLYTNNGVKPVTTQKNLIH